MTQSTDRVLYDLIPAVSAVENDFAWDIRITSGDFVETVIRYGNIALNEEENALSFNFFVVSSPIKDLNEDDEKLQMAASDILEHVLEEAIKHESLLLRDAESED